jgi:hypothetical protein
MIIIIAQLIVHEYHLQFLSRNSSASSIILFPVRLDNSFFRSSNEINFSLIVSAATSSASSSVSASSR